MYKYICARFDPCKTESKRDNVVWVCRKLFENGLVFPRITHRRINHRNEIINISVDLAHGHFYVYVPISESILLVNSINHKDSDAIISYIWDSICTEVNEVKGAKKPTLYKLDRNSGKYAILNCFGMTEEEYYERFIKGT